VKFCVSGLHKAESNSLYAHSSDAACASRLFASAPMLQLRCGKLAASHCLSPGCCSSSSEWFDGAGLAVLLDALFVALTLVPVSQS
jgi:hypothetical protein